jgi:hypothetical protein
LFKRRNDMKNIQTFLRSFRGTGTGTDRHRHLPAPTGTDRHRPAQTGTDRHGPAPYRHGINLDYLVVNNDEYQFLKYFFHLNRSKS